MLKNIVVMVAVIMFSLFVSASSVSAGTDCYVGCPKVIKRTTVVKRYYMNGTDKEARQRLDTVEGRVSTLETQMPNKANTADVNAAFAETNGRIDRVENRVHAIETWWTLSPVGTFFLVLAVILLIAAIAGGYFFPRHGAVAAAPAAPQYPPYPAYPPFPAYPQQQPPVANQPPPVAPAQPSINVPLNVTVTPIDIELTPRIRGAQ